MALSEKRDPSFSINGMPRSRPLELDTIYDVPVYYYYSKQKHGSVVSYFFPKVFHCLCHFPDLIGI